ncbi:dihydrofolate reductase family protein [Angustibacter sp. McL0619]|uniref:dihydrofolate reductase family protein n=1 Tax=Angustibacter sp. McL0619 TaxID=3415676 RepID=UPI003CF5974B
MAGKVIAGITISVDGYITGPDDAPGRGLGAGGERLHYWVFGGPWTYEAEREFGSMDGIDKEFYDDLTAGLGTGICGRGMYEAAGAWGGTNPFPGPLFVLTHRIEDAPDPATGFTFVDSLAEALEQARAEADGKDVSIAGGADLIRQALAGGHVDQLALSISPVVLGGGKRLFEGFEQDVDLEIDRVYASQWATHIRYTIKR